MGQLRFFVCEDCGQTHVSDDGDVVGRKHLNSVDKTDRCWLCSEIYDQERKRLKANADRQNRIYKEFTKKNRVRSVREIR